MRQVMMCLVMLLSLIGGSTPVAAVTTAVVVQDGDPTDAAFAKVRERFQNLVTSLQSSADADAAQRQQAVEVMLERVRAFRADHPDHAPALAMEVQLLTWLRDRTGEVEAGYRTLSTLLPTDPEVRMAWARAAMRRNEYARTIEILDGYEFDYAKTPDAATMLSEALFAEHRFEDAVAAMKMVDDATLAQFPLVQNEVRRLLPTRESYIDLWAKEQDIRRREAEADDLPRAEIITDRGRIVVELFENEAPNTVANFVSLTDSGFYDGTTFHRVEPNNVIQGGDPNTRTGEGLAGQGNPGYYIADEFRNADLRRNHFTGSLAMARTQAPNTAGCQFYITLRPTFAYNGNYTVFGRVIEGMDVVRQMQRNDAILAARMLRKRDHDYEPRTIPLQPVAAPTTPDATGDTPGTTTPATTPATTPVTVPESLGTGGGTGG